MVLVLVLSLEREAQEAVLEIPENDTSVENGADDIIVLINCQKIPSIGGF